MVDAQDVEFGEVSSAAHPPANGGGKAVAMRAESAPVPTQQHTGGAMTPFQMLNVAIERGDSIEKLKELMDLNDRWEKKQAHKAFIEAKAAFKAVAPKILKDKENKQYNSMYASIGNVVNTLNAAMAPFGLDVDWDFDQSGGDLKCTCTLKHVAGHSESRTLSGKPDTSGNKNAHQQVKSAFTYLKLQTYEAVVGVTTAEGNLDDDGNAASRRGGAAPQDDEPISAAELESLRALCESAGADEALFAKICKVDSLERLPRSKLDGARARLLEKKNGGSK